MEETSLDFSKMKAYGARYLDKGNLLTVASGGVATAISETIIKAGGVVFGVRYSSNYMEAYYDMAKTVEELEWFKGTKYILARKIYKRDDVSWSLFDEIECAMRKFKYVLLIGLGCDIGIVKHYLEMHQVEMKNLFCVDLICHGAVHPLIHKSFLLFLKEKYGSEIVYYNVKSKKNGWELPTTYARFLSGKIYKKPFHETEFGFIFDNYPRIQCVNCNYKGKNHLSDLTIGDYWGLKKEKEIYSRDGTSIVLSHSEKGEFLISLLNNLEGFMITPENVSDALRYNPMYYKKRDVNADYDKVLREIKEVGIVKAVKNNICFRIRITRWVKGFLRRLLPRRIIEQVREWKK